MDTKIFFLAMGCALMIASCKAKNQYRGTVTDGNVAVKQRHGKWVIKERDSDGEYVTRTRYKNGEQVGTAKTFYQGKLYYKSVFKKEGYAKITYYHPNGKVSERGKTRTTNEIDDGRFWRYTGLWSFYTDNGKLKYTKNYVEGVSQDSISYVKKEP